MKVFVDTRGLDEARRRIVESFSQRRVNAVAATALTRVAGELRKGWADELQSKFDRPTPATTRATATKRATATDLQAEVFIKGSASGTPPVEWLTPEESGGQRRLKKFEQALVAQGSMPQGHYAVPGPAAKLDAYGNVSRGQIVQVIAQVGAKFSPGYERVISQSAAKRVAKALKIGRAYVAIPKGQGDLRPGVYERKGRGLVAVFYFVRRATYRPRTRLIGRAEQEAPKLLQREVGRALQENIERVMARGGV